jgi:hypothetical protein
MAPNIKLVGEISALKSGSILGKCTFCAGKIISDHRAVSSKFAVMHNAKWLCGDCIVGMKDTVDRIAKAAQKYLDIMEHANIDTETDVVVDWETGKLIKVSK